MTAAEQQHIAMLDISHCVTRYIGSVYNLA